MFYQFEREKINRCMECPCFRTIFDTAYCSLSERVLQDANDLLLDKLFDGQIPDWCELKEVGNGD